MPRAITASRFRSVLAHRASPAWLHAKFSMQIQLENMQPISRSTTRQKQGRTLLAGSLSHGRNTRKHDIAVEGFISVCSVCSVVKKNGISSSLKDGTENADVPRAALRSALVYLILPPWGGDITTLSRRDCPRFLAKLPCAPYRIRISDLRRDRL